MDKKGKQMEEKKPVGLVQALDILHKLRDLFDTLDGFEDVVGAFDTVFGWVDGACLLLNKIGGVHHG